MNLQGSAISFPFRTDATGTFLTTDDRRTVIEEAIADVIETRLGERVMVPGYGIPDFVFAVQNFSFGHRLAYVLREQIRAYVPLVRDVEVKATTDDQGRAVVDIRYREVGAVNAPGNMVYPVWRLRNA